MTLLDLKRGETSTVRALGGDTALTRRMQALGLFVGKRVRFLRAGPFSGPLLVEDLATGARLMIARALARLVHIGDDGARGR